MPLQVSGAAGPLHRVIGGSAETELVPVFMIDRSLPNVAVGGAEVAVDLMVRSARRVKGRNTMTCSCFMRDFHPILIFA